MKSCGLTGGIGMGKSTAAELLRQRGYAVVDTDLLARQVVEPGQPALTEIQDTFGREVISSTGELLRAKLANKVFSNPAERKKLEAIVHPRIRERWLTQLESWRAEGQQIAVVIIPLLFETNATACFDKIICVACSARSQRGRLLARGLTDMQIGQRIAAQMPIERKMELSDHVVWTEPSLEVHAAQLERIFR
jgi:dephospho-CoA kinase